MIVPQPVTTPSPRDLTFFHAEIGAVVFDEGVDLLEGAVIEQKADPFARRQFAALMLRLDAPFATTKARLLPALFEFDEDLFHSSGSGLLEAPRAERQRTERWGRRVRTTDVCDMARTIAENRPSDQASRRP